MSCITDDAPVDTQDHLLHENAPSPRKEEIGQTQTVTEPSNVPCDVQETTDTKEFANIHQKVDSDIDNENKGKLIVNHEVVDVKYTDIKRQRYGFDLNYAISDHKRIENKNNILNKIDTSKQTRGNSNDCLTKREKSSVKKIIKDEMSDRPKSVISVEIHDKPKIDAMEPKSNVNEKRSREDLNPLDSVSIAKSNPEHSKDSSTTKGATKSDQPQAKSKADAAVVTNAASSGSKLKKMKKGIFLSYSPDAGYQERKFVVETARQLKDNNMADDIWFDKDEKNTDSPCWFSMRMEAVEKCRAAICILSDNYFSCPVSVYEGKTLLERQKLNPETVKIFLVLFSPLENTEYPKQYNSLRKHVVDLTSDHSKKSVAEKTSVVIGAIMEDLEHFATMNMPPTPFTPPDTEFTGEYKKKKICQWSANDLQEWLFKLSIKEFYRQSLAENMVDGFLLMSLTDYDMIHHLGIDSRVIRKKIMQNILQTLDKEHKQADNWHLRARAQRSKPDIVYIIYDPLDIRLAQNIETDLKKKNLQVNHHDSRKLGNSKDEFLQANGPAIAMATNVIVLMTEAAVSSPFVFHEILFADWLGKKLVTAMFKNTWFKLRPSLKAVLGECPAIDFETKLYAESLDVLEHHIKPLRRVPGVVLEQAYLNKMAEGLRPLEILCTARNGMSSWSQEDSEPRVFISYQWDMQPKVVDIRTLLESNGIPCWSDINVTQRLLHSSMSSRSSQSHLDAAGDLLQSQIHRNMKSAALVLCCITPKYLQSDNCIKDLTLAESLNKPIIPLLLRYSPPDGASPQIRKVLSRLHYIDLSNDRLYKQNIQQVLDRVRKVINHR